MTSSDEQSLDSIADLAAFLADLGWTRQRFRYCGVEIESVPSRGRGSLLALLFNSLLYALVRSAEHAHGDGVHLRVTLPIPVASDLRLESRRQPAEGESDPLAKHFTWTATSDERVRRYLGQSFADTLVRSSAHYRIVMTDDEVRIGPLVRTTAQDAEAVDALVKALPRPEEPDGTRPSVEAAAESPVADPTVLRCTTSRTEADLWRALLEGAGIPCWCEGYEASPPWGAATPPMEIRLLVSSEHADAAGALIERAAHAAEMRLCHHCGETLTAKTDVCPACRAALDE